MYFNFNYISLLIFYTISYDLQVKVPSPHLTAVKEFRMVPFKHSVSLFSKACNLCCSFFIFESIDTRSLFKSIDANLG